MKVTPLIWGPESQNNEYPKFVLHYNKFNLNLSVSYTVSYKNYENYEKSPLAYLTELINEKK